MDFDYTTMSSSKKSNEHTKLLIVVVLAVICFFLYMIYKNYMMVKTGALAEIEKKARSNKRNRQYWDASEIG